MTVRKVLTDTSVMSVRTSRIGLLTIRATAPIVDGQLSDSALSFTVRIDEVSTGNPLVDPELHALVHELTSGTLTFDGRRQGEIYSGKASAGQISVPLSLAATVNETLVTLAGTSTFQDLHLPIPGLGHVKHLEVDIDGNLHLA